MKKFWIMLLSVLTIITCALGITACKKSDVLSGYVLTENGSLVDSEFVLPATIGGEKVSWTSDNTDALAIEQRDADYLAKVTLGDETKTVNLTVKCGKEEKTFSVTVAALDVHYFVKKFNFAQENATVFADFDLVTTSTINGKTATISWAVEKEEDQNYIKVSEDGKKCLVTTSSLNPQVKITATFSYNNKTTKVPYRLTVSFERAHQEEVDYWYYNTGVSITMSGYVLAIGTVYSEQYENVTLYMVDDDFCAGYYLYRVKADKETGKALKVGDHITVTNTTNTNYNGLIETNAGGNLVIDKDKEALTEAQLREKVYAIDNDILAGSPAALYHTSALVSLDKWTVDSKASKKPDSNGTVFTLTKGGKKVTVATSKYFEGIYAVGDETFNAICNTWDSLEKGDVVSVTGILGNYNGYQIMPLKADDIVKESVGATEAPAACTSVGKAIAAVNKLFKDNGISYAGQAGYTIVDDKEITCISYEGVEIEYKLIREPSATVVIEDGKIKITAGVEDIAGMKVTYTVKHGDAVAYTTTTYHSIHSQKMSDEDVVEKVKFELQLAETDLVGMLDLVSTNSQYPGSKIKWSLKEEVECATVSTGKSQALYITPSTEKAYSFVLVATVTYGEASTTKEFTITVPKVDPVETGTFVLALQQANLKKKLYFTGEVNGSGFGVTTENVGEAAAIAVEAVENGFTFKVNGKYLELNEKNRLTLVDAPTSAWGYEYKLKVFTWTIGSKVYYLGTYGTFDTINASETWRISGANAEAVGKSQFVAGFETVAKIEAGAYKMSMQLPEKTLYFKGTVTDKGYGETTENISEAVDVVVEVVEDGYKLKVGDKYLELVLSGKHTNIALAETSSGVWTYDYSLKVFTWTLGEKIYYLGTYASTNNDTGVTTIRETIGASETKFISGENASKVGVSQFVVKLEKPAEE